MPEPTQEQWLEIQQHLANGQMIQAIKAYRLATGLGLKESKDAMEAYLQKLQAEAPDRFPQRTKSGCMGVIVVFAVLVAGVVTGVRSLLWGG